ncbi:MAG: acyl-CoA dehydrogenase family protein [Acidimicrobiales bacterium]
MDCSYTPHQLELKRRARELASSIKEHEQQCEQQDGLGEDVLDLIKKATLAAGLNAINMPQAWGGAGLSILDQVLVQEELGQLTNALWDAVWRPANALKACDEAQRERYLLPAIRGERRDAYAVTEADAGSDYGSITTTATPAGDRYRIDGEKWFVTVGDIADFLIVMAKVPPEGSLTLFLVDRDQKGVSITRTPSYMHTFVFKHPIFAFEGVEVGRDRVLGGIGAGGELTREWFVEERLMIAARALGGAERALSEATEWAKVRQQFGHALIENQLIAAMLSDSAVDIATNRAFVYQVAAEADAKMPRKLLHAKASMVKLSASEAAGRVIDRAVQVFGGRGYMREYAVERLYRDIRVDRIWEGTSEIQRLVISNEISKRGLSGLISPWP